MTLAYFFCIMAYMKEAVTSLKSIAPTLKFVNTKIMEKRKAYGMTQAALAIRLGKSRLFVVEAESGEKDITLSVLYDLAEIFCCPVTDFLPPQKLDEMPVQIRGDSISAPAMSEVSAILRGIRDGN